MALTVHSSPNALRLRPPSDVAESAYQETLGRLVRDVHLAAATAMTRKLSAHGATQTQWLALRYIGNAGRCRVGAVAGSLGHEAGSTTRLVRRLERAGWAVRTLDGADRRTVLLKLTPAGRIKIEELEQVANRFWSETLEALTSKERSNLASFLARLGQTLG